MCKPTPNTKEVVITYLASFIMHLILWQGHSSFLLQIFKPLAGLTTENLIGNAERKNS
jgi:hypothetical protein